MSGSKGRFVEMVGCKGDVIPWVKVPGGDSEGEPGTFHQIVDDGSDFSAVFDR